MRKYLLILSLGLWGCDVANPKAINRLEATVKMEQKIAEVEKHLKEACDSSIAEQARQQFFLQQQKNAIVQKKK